MTTASKQLNVLLAEDSKTQARLVKTAFAGVDELNLVGVAENGVQVLEYLRGDGKFEAASRPDVILLDINMPEMDGFEVLDALKADPDFCGIPIVMLTTSSDDDDISRAYAAGASTFITKPIDYRNLERTFECFAQYWVTVAQLPNK